MDWELISIRLLCRRQLQQELPGADASLRRPRLAPCDLEQLIDSLPHEAGHLRLLDGPLGGDPAEGRYEVLPAEPDFEFPTNLRRILKTCDCKVASSAAIQRKGATRYSVKNLIRNLLTN